MPSSSLQVQLPHLPLHLEWSLVPSSIPKQKDSLVFGENQIKKLELINKNYSLEFVFEDNIKAVTLWTVSEKTDNSKYICIEPWSNIPTTEKYDNVEALKSRENKYYKYKIIFKKCYN